MRFPLFSLLLLAALLTSLPAHAEVATDPELAASFTDDHLTVTGTTPGGEVAVLTVWRERFPGWSRTTRFSELLSDDDGDGTVELALERELPEGSLWIVTDVANGAYVVATPRPWPFPELEAAERRLNPSLNTLEVDRETLELLLVRPGEGAWSLTVWDGGTGDDDLVPDGRLTATLPSFEPLGLTEPLQQPRPGDLLFGIEARRMEWFAAPVGPTAPQR